MVEAVEAYAGELGELREAREVLRALWNDLDRRAARAAELHDRLHNHEGTGERRIASDALVELHLLGNISFSNGHQVLKALKTR